ncbi:amidase [Aminobacter niigataensis]|nr:amidase [Aminobacter niigataensis]
MALWKHDVAELNAGYKFGRFDPVDVLSETQARIRVANPILNAIITPDEKGAAEAAHASAMRWRAGQPLGPLDGVPITVKDNLQVRGLRCSWGSKLFADHVPDADESPVERLRAAGAIILGKTNVPEFTLQGFTDNLLFGATGNPWDPNLSPGGSSGGAVAATASGMGVFAVGTDGGGSIRRPCGHTGLYGLKPSPGFVGRSGGLPGLLLDFETVGPMTRSARDLRLAASVLAAHDPNDRASFAFPAKARIGSYRVPKTTRILYVPRFGSAPVDTEIAASVDRAASRLVDLGCRVDQGETPFDAEMLDAIWGMVGPVGLAWLMQTRDATQVNESLVPMIRTGGEVNAMSYFDMLTQVGRLRAQLAKVFATYNFIMTPSIAALSWPKLETHPSRINGIEVGPRGHAVFTAFANAGGLPGVAIPASPSSGGLPIGFQLVGAFGSDNSLIDLAEHYDNAYGGYQWPAI